MSIASEAIPFVLVLSLDRGVHTQGRLYMMTFINWESLLKITHAENLFSCLSDSPFTLSYKRTVEFLGFGADRSEP